MRMTTFERGRVEDILWRPAFTTDEDDNLGKRDEDEDEDEIFGKGEGRGHPVVTQV